MAGWVGRHGGAAIDYAALLCERVCVCVGTFDDQQADKVKQLTDVLHQIDCTNTANRFRRVQDTRGPAQPTQTWNVNDSNQSGNYT